MERERENEMNEKMGVLSLNLEMPSRYLGIQLTTQI